MTNIKLDARGATSLAEAINEAVTLGAYEFRVTNGGGDTLSFFHGQWYVNGKEAESVPITWLSRQSQWKLAVSASRLSPPRHAPRAPVSKRKRS